MGLSGAHHLFISNPRDVLERIDALMSSRGRQAMRRKGSARGERCSISRRPDDLTDGCFGSRDAGGFERVESGTSSATSPPPHGLFCRVEEG